MDLYSGTFISFINLTMYAFLGYLSYVSHFGRIWSGCKQQVDVRRLQEKLTILYTEKLFTIQLTIRQ
jgi:hypothetical protein